MKRYAGTELRNVDIQHDMLRFRRNLERIGELMAYEISRTFDYKKIEITTPLASAECEVVADGIVLGLKAKIPLR